MSDALIDRLARGLTPVRRRRVSEEFELLGLLALAEAAALVAGGLARGDVADGGLARGGLAGAMPPIAVWKIGAPLLIAVVATIVALGSADPSRPRVRIGQLFGSGALALLAGVGAAAGFFDGPTAGFAVRAGLACVAVAAVFAVPPALMLGWLLARAAPAHPRRTAAAAAVAAGALGAALLGLHCPDDGAAHSLFWHPLGVLLPALAAAIPIARMARW